MFLSEAKATTQMTSMAQGSVGKRLQYKKGLTGVPERLRSYWGSQRRLTMGQMDG